MILLERRDQHHDGRKTLHTRVHSRPALALFSWPGVQQAKASCGAVSCFVVIGSQQQVPQAGLLTVNAIYNYTPMRVTGREPTE